MPLLESKAFSFDLDAFDRVVNEQNSIDYSQFAKQPYRGCDSPKDMQHIADAARRYDCWILSDEIYNQIIFDGLIRASIASLPGMAERSSHS